MKEKKNTKKWKFFWILRTHIHKLKNIEFNTSIPSESVSENWSQCLRPKTVCLQWNQHSGTTIHPLHKIGRIKMEMIKNNKKWKG